MENSIYICTCETYDTIYLQATIPDVALEAPLSEIVALAERSLMAYVVNSWKHVKQFWFVRYIIVKDGKELVLAKFYIDDIARMYGLED